VVVEGKGSVVEAAAAAAATAAAAEEAEEAAALVGLVASEGETALAALTQGPHPPHTHGPNQCGESTPRHIFRRHRKGGERHTKMCCDRVVERSKAYAP
jgi:hypothetical protein